MHESIAAEVNMGTLVRVRRKRLDKDEAYRDSIDKRRGDLLIQMTKQLSIVWSVLLRSSYIPAISDLLDPFLQRHPDL